MRAVVAGLLALVAPLLSACGGRQAAPAAPADDPADRAAQTYDNDGFGESDVESGAPDGGEDDEPTFDEATFDDEGADAPSPPALLGTWMGACAAAGAAFVRPTLTFTATRWDLRVERFADAACGHRRSLVHATGDYRFDGASDAVAGAWRATTSHDLRELTVDDKATARALSAACGVKLAVGQAVSLAESGCAAAGLAAAGTCDGDQLRVVVHGDALGLDALPSDAAPCRADQPPTASDAGLALAFQWPSTGLAACDSLSSTLRRFGQCRAQDESGEPMLEAFHIAFAGFVQAATNPAAAGAVTASCQQVDAGLSQRLSALGCAPAATASPAP